MRRIEASPKEAISSNIASAYLAEILSASIRTASRGGRSAIVQVLVHHQRIDKAGGRVAKGTGKAPDGLEARPLPCLDRPRVRRDDEIVLHGPIPLRAGRVEGMRQKSPCDPVALGASGRAIPCAAVTADTFVGVRIK